MYNGIPPYLVKNKIVNFGCRELNTIESQENGYLKLNVYRYVQRTPVADAFVRVSKLVIGGFYRESGSGYFLTTAISDENGSVPIFELPVLTSENEMYNVSVQAQGFCPAYILNVPVYPNITTTYNVYLRDLDISGEPNFYFILQPQIPGH